MKDLKLLDTVSMSEKGVEFKPLDFDGDELGCTFYLKGVDSRQVAKAQDRRTREYSKNVFSGATGRKNEIDFTTVDADIEFCVDAFIGWKEVIWEGKPLEFSKEHVRMLMTQVPFLRDQVTTFVGQRKNFRTPAPQK